MPFKKRFSYQLGKKQKISAFRVNGLLIRNEVDYTSVVLTDTSSSFAEGELSVLVDHRETKAADGVLAVYSPEAAERAVPFQQKIFSRVKQSVVLCNSYFMVHQMNVVTLTSRIRDKATNLYGSDRDMTGNAYLLIDIHGNKLIKVAK
ncbi:XRE family transcriptional regulator [Paenibacillus sp. FSL R7-269]|uniref:hypothetical protein n=1 Tax=Paenibacillus sp. FSL R7-269 TaxID=1226755 RepID=UPI0003E2C1F8|nr:hypothetical protein [Paenibacillus sp. FSL R7-269]ETT53143.1 XRE family transcriptional regulator [Paenibacillus sp. FSL R7-269]